tara:strand:- start:116 stop:409 length:294 start_codon:yes stop_codon:yes gene_type:complete
MKRLLTLSALLLFSFNGWADEIILECKPKRNASKTLSVVIDKQAKTFLIDGFKMQLVISKNEYRGRGAYGFPPVLNRITKELRQGTSRYSCEETSRI